jgi:ABC-type protease/lipase transport system fused ATPase/permease subunit
MQSFKDGFTKNWFLGVCIVIGSFIIVGYEMMDPNKDYFSDEAIKQREQEQQQQKQQAGEEQAEAMRANGMQYNAKTGQYEAAPANTGN